MKTKKKETKAARIRRLEAKVVRLACTLSRRWGDYEPVSDYEEEAAAVAGAADELREARAAK